MAKFIFHKKGEKMKGVVLTNGIIRAEDGNRYSFELGDVVNLNDLSDLSELEVDFEPHENTAKSICLLNQKGKIVSKCEEIQKLGNWYIFRGIAKVQQETTITETVGKIATSIWGATSGNIKSNSFSRKTIVLGNEYFYLTEDIMSSFGSGNIIANGDDVAILGAKSQGGYNICAFYNVTRKFYNQTKGGWGARFAFWIMLVVWAMLSGIFAIIIGGFADSEDVGASAFWILYIPGLIFGFIMGKKYKKASKAFKEYVKTLK